PPFQRPEAVLSIALGRTLRNCDERGCVVAELTADRQLRTTTQLDNAPAARTAASGHNVQWIDEQRAMHAPKADWGQLIAQLLQRRTHEQRSIAGDQFDIVAGSLDVFDIAGPH